MPNWLWPAKPARETGPAIRLGRVAHWLATLFAFFLLLAAVNVQEAEPAIYAIMLAALGRGVRYIIGNE